MAHAVINGYRPTTTVEKKIDLDRWLILGADKDRRCVALAQRGGRCTLRRHHPEHYPLYCRHHYKKFLDLIAKPLF